MAAATSMEYRSQGTISWFMTNRTASARLDQMASHLASSTRGWFDKIEQAPPDPIFNLNTAFKADQTAHKINVGVGAYRDDHGKPWVLPIVRTVEKALANDQELDHEYLPIEGMSEFTKASARLVLGDGSPAIAEDRWCAVQAISGTGSIRIGAAFLRRFHKDAKVFVSNPTWGPHHTIFSDAGLEVCEYPYFDPQTNGLDFAGIVNAIKCAPTESIFVLHACAHNPTGVDPSLEQWNALADLLAAKGHFPFFDCAYQGFATGDLDRDAQAIRLFVARGFDVFVAQSYSKNFGLYSILPGYSRLQAAAVKSQLARIIRSMISNPPAHGARIVAKVLNDPKLFGQWHAELLVMVERIRNMRKALHDRLVQLKTPGKWNHIVEQIGMFSYTGLSKRQSLMMRSRFNIYMTDNGRISMAGLNSSNIQYFAESMDQVVRGLPRQ